MQEGETLTLRPLTEEESKEVLESFEKFKEERGVALNAIPVYMDGPSGRWETDVQVRFFKVVKEEKGDGKQKD